MIIYINTELQTLVHFFPKTYFLHRGSYSKKLFRHIDTSMRLSNFTLFALMGLAIALIPSDPLDSDEENESIKTTTNSSFGNTVEHIQGHCPCTGDQKDCSQYFVDCNEGYQTSIRWGGATLLLLVVGGMFIVF